MTPTIILRDGRWWTVPDRRRIVAWLWRWEFVITGIAALAVGAASLWLL